MDNIIELRLNVRIVNQFKQMGITSIAALEVTPRSKLLGRVGFGVCSLEELCAKYLAYCKREGKDPNGAKFYHDHMTYAHAITYEQSEDVEYLRALITVLKNKLESIKIIVNNKREQ